MNKHHVDKLWRVRYGLYTLAGSVVVAGAVASGAGAAWAIEGGFPHAFDGIEGGLPHSIEGGLPDAIDGGLPIEGGLPN